ncbi:MAG: glycosyltransferase family 39 protein [Candidatus Saccharimonadales bacterium]
MVFLVVTLSIGYQSRYDSSNTFMKDLFKKKIAFVKRHPRLDIVFLLVGLAIFATITLLNASRASIWFDEAFSAYIAQFSFADIATFTASDVHPPFYYWVLKVWTMFFGTDELGFRSMSMFFGAGVITAATLLARRFFGRLVAGVTLLFLIVSPMLIRYSDEARMYTLAAAIILIATYVLVKATETNKRWQWIVYGILIALGMWTHYFTALAWIAHWVWRAIVIRKSTTKPKLFWKKFFTKNWIVAHIVAAALFLPWIPFMVIQLGGIQASGFWIGPVGVNSVTNYFTNLFYYLEHDQVEGWAGVALIVVLVGLGILAYRTYRSFKKETKTQYLLVSALAFVPVLFLFVVSLPPLHSSFVERYLLPAIVGFAMFAAVTIVVGTRRWKPVFRVASVLVLVGMMVYGIVNVYHYGNYNKNSNTHVLTQELVQKIAAEAKPGEPIVANAPWIFYEAVFYNSADHPIYFIDQDTQYIYGSLEMLKTRDQHKIIDIDAFTKEHPTIWYIGVSGGDIESSRSDWHKVKSISVTSPVDGQTLYRATEFTIN